MLTTILLQMKLMIDVTPALTEALARAIAILRGEMAFPLVDTNSQELQQLKDQIYERNKDWYGDLSVDEVSYYAPGPEQTVPLGKQLIFDPHTAMNVQQPGMYMIFPRRHMITHRFEIGKDHTGMLIMNYEAWKALGMAPSTEPQKPDQ
jgi:hypothetical protein